MIVDMRMLNCDLMIYNRCGRLFPAVCRGRLFCSSRKAGEGCFAAVGRQGKVVLQQ